MSSIPSLSPLRLTLRRLVHDWRFTTAATLTLALAIAANTVIFGAVYTVLVRPLPMAHADRLHAIWNGTSRSDDRTAVAIVEFLDLRDRASVFDGVAAIRDRAVNLTGAGEPLRLNGLMVSPELGRVLGIRMFAGRDFEAADDESGRAVLLAHHVWSQVFGADRAVIGRAIELDGRPHVVVGVLPPDLVFPDAASFAMPRRADVWLPGGWPRQRSDWRGNQILRVLAAARAGVPAAAIEQDLLRISAGFRREVPDRYTEQSGWRLVSTPFREELVGGSRPVLLLLAGGAFLVLVIACCNVAGLLIGRGAARRKELTVMAALGAGRWRLVRDFTIESAALGVLAGAGALTLSAWAMPALAAVAPETLPHMSEMRLDAASVAFAAVLTGVVALLVGVIPAIRATSGDLQPALRDSAAGDHRVWRSLRAALVSGEMAVAFLVLTLAGLLVKSVNRLDGADLGFTPDRVTVVRVALPPDRYPQPEHRAAFFDTLLTGLREQPSIEGAALADPVPLSGEAWSATLAVEGVETRPGDPLPHAEFYRVSPGYVGTLGLRLIAGREFSAQDDMRSPFVVMVDEQFAAKYWPGQEAVGRRVNPRGATAPWSTIVGVVARVRRDGPRHTGEPQIYLPYFQSRAAMMNLVVRSAVPPSQVVGTVRRVVQEIDRSLPVSDLVTMRMLADRVRAADRFGLQLTTAFAACALLLAAVGLYSVIAYVVTERTREIGIRMALGSTPAGIMRRVLAQTSRWAVVGIATGTAGAVAISRSIASLLFDVSPLDTATLLVSAVVTLGVALAATLVPARRAASLDPLTALKE